jgi:CDP-diacylglycerol---serine O-phosphatidyltransferase
MKQHIPNAITCCNLACGCLAILEACAGELENASYLVGLAVVFDFMDGLAARMLRVVSKIGKDLDSLADMVTFGVVPGILLYKLIQVAIAANITEGEAEPGVWMRVLPLTAILMCIFAAIRLAKFNNDPRQTDSFIGLPTPASAMVIASLPLIMSPNGETGTFLEQPQSPWLLAGLAILMSFLMVSEIHLFALKFKHFHWRGNEVRFLFLAACAVLLGLLQYAALPVAILIYIVISLFIGRRSRVVQ